METYYSVITIRDGVVENNYLLVGYNNIFMRGVHSGKKVNKVAEELFIQKCKHDPIFNKLSDDEVESILDDGYYESHTEDYVVCLGEPEIY